MESLFTVTVGLRRHRAIQEWTLPGMDGGAYMVHAACGTTLYPRTDRNPLRVKSGQVDCPGCLAADK